MWARVLLAPILVLSAAAQDGAEPAPANGKARVELSTLDQNCPGVLLGLPKAVAHLDRPRGGLAIDLLPDRRIGLYLRMQICTQDMFGRDRFCTGPPDFLFEGRIQEAGSVQDRDDTRTLYDIILEPGTLRTRLLITGQGEYYLIVPLDSEYPQYQRVKLFANQRQ